MRGEIFTLNQKKFFTFGGASSHDIEDGIIIMDKEGKWRQKEKHYRQMGKGRYRIKNLTWWETELPTQEELEHGLENLERNDYLNKGYSRDILTEYFDEIAEKVSFQKWFFGHYHEDRQISEKYILLYKQIMKII